MKALKAPLAPEMKHVLAPRLGGGVASTPLHSPAPLSQLQVPKGRGWGRHRSPYPCPPRGMGPGPVGPTWGRLAGGKSSSGKNSLSYPFLPRNGALPVHEVHRAVGILCRDGHKALREDKHTGTSVPRIPARPLAEPSCDPSGRSAQRVTGPSGKGTSRFPQGESSSLCCVQK